MKTHLKRAALAVMTTSTLLAGNAFAALAATDTDPIKAEVLADIALVAGVGLAIMAVSLGWDVGFGLLKKFVKKGAK